ncbi:hypothetical protein V5P09_25530 [Escherichia coli]
MRKKNMFPPGSLSIKLNKPLTKYEVIEILSEYLSMLEITFGIKEFRLFSYLECVLNGEKQAIYHKGNNAIVSGFLLDSMKDVNNRKINKILLGDNDFDAMQKIDGMLNMKAESNPYEYFKSFLSLVPANIAYDLIRKTEELIELERMERIKEKNELRKKKIEKDKNILKVIYNNKITEYSCTFDYFRSVYLSSSGFLSSEKQKAKYFLAEGLDSLLKDYVGKRLVRLSIKGDDGKVSIVEIYDENGGFLFKTKPLNKSQSNI